MSDTDALLLSEKLRKFSKASLRACREVQVFVIKQAEPHFRPAGLQLIHRDPGFRTRKLARLNKPVQITDGFIRNVSIEYIADDGELFSSLLVGFWPHHFPFDELAKLIDNIGEHGFADDPEDSGYKPERVTGFF